MPFDIRQLRYAIAAAEHGSFYRAARALDIDQSTLGRNILKLERVIGGKIFRRSRAGVTMTIARITFIRGVNTTRTLKIGIGLVDAAAARDGCTEWRRRH